MALTFSFLPRPVVSTRRAALGKLPGAPMQNLNLRHIGALILGTALFALGCATSKAQDWPVRPITMVVPFAAGGPMDSLARILQPTLSETLGQQVIIENMPGGGGLVGSLRVSQAAVDSHMF